MSRVELTQPGVDGSHNPEFTICEFYAIMLTLDDLIILTERLFAHLDNLAKSTEFKLTSLRRPETSFTPPFARLEFIPTLETQIRARYFRDWTFPNLDKPDSAQASLVNVCIAAGITIPVPATLPRILDALAAHFLEPLCTAPTFITHHPECMSPLSKSYLRDPLHPASDPGTPNPNTQVRHRVSARAELFIRGREYVNCYEEENSPLDQRRKFVDQLGLRSAGDDEAHGVVDESYVQALEWGMPPTGGWGCGVDRIVMLFGGKGRIADVLPFGNLRHVVGLGRVATMSDKDKAGAAETPEVAPHDANVQPSAENYQEARGRMSENAEPPPGRTARRVNGPSNVKEWPSADLKVSKAPDPEVDEVHGARRRERRAEEQRRRTEEVATRRAKQASEAEAGDGQEGEVRRKQEVKTKLADGKVLSFRDLMG